MLNLLTLHSRTAASSCKPHRLAIGSGASKSRQILRARCSFISLCRGTAEAFFAPRFTNTECRPPSLSSSQPCCSRCRTKSFRFTSKQFSILLESLLQWHPLAQVRGWLPIRAEPLRASSHALRREWEPEYSRPAIPRRRRRSPPGLFETLLSIQDA